MNIIWLVRRNNVETKTIARDMTHGGKILRYLLGYDTVVTQYPEDGGDTILRNAVNYLADYTPLRPTTPQFEIPSLFMLL
jgi:hypothetical protein